MTTSFTEGDIKNIGNILIDVDKPLKERFRALFSLRNIGGETAINCISRCFDDSSALLKHECAYCLGQMQDKTAIPVLSNMLRETKENAMVRHEAGEALGAIGSSESLEILEEFSKDPIIEVAETCQLAVQRIKWLSAGSDKDLSKNPYNSVDPAPPATEENTSKLQEILTDETLPLFQRYRAMFSLRNKGDKDSILALAEGMKCKSALFRHEVAYVLGQIQSPLAEEALANNLKDGEENAMVRHECAEALGAIATDSCMSLLKEFVGDKERVVKESCDVALDMCEYENSDNLQYATTLGDIGQNGH